MSKLVLLGVVLPYRTFSIDDNSVIHDLSFILQFAAEREREIEERTEAERMESFRRQLIEEERQKLLREHAKKLLGYLPKVSPPVLATTPLPFLSLLTPNPLTGYYSFTTTSSVNVTNVVRFVL